MRPDDARTLSSRDVPCFLNGCQDFVHAPLSAAISPLPASFELKRNPYFERSCRWNIPLVPGLAWLLAVNAQFREQGKRLS